MKTAFRTLTMVSAMSTVLLLANCSQDADPGPDEVILGKWNFTSVIVTITVDSQTLVDYYISTGLTAAEAQLEAEEDQAEYEGLSGGSIDFKNGGTYSALAWGNLVAGTWELSSDRKTLTMEKGTPYVYDYTITTLTSANLNMTRIILGTNSTKTFTTRVDVELTK